ncbi:hypothetical protein A6A04_03695 [Paramagnetospirillum marisnigri]|uniref:Uncharacterized protein n=1 Tax=Paramagnetospirillum marisnigri TaxID=1285242 RepID=A0A178MMB1_9PROT|nr:SxtJ family membrane protein [Paramagnetospirillum marisnigri]OAN49228.1 hypothetical protein A6A04_03695 [Paramagnetospirillum marisnigri]
MAVRQTNRAFGLTFAAVFAVIAAVGWLVFDARLIWALEVSAVFAVVALAAPLVLLPLNRLWAVLAGGLGHVNNHLILGLFFYGFVTPAGLLMRLIGKDPMTRGIDPAAASYLTPVGRKAGAETYRDLF